MTTISLPLDLRFEALFESGGVEETQFLRRLRRVAKGSILVASGGFTVVDL
jgi:hypothetical protein